MVKVVYYTDDMGNIKTPITEATEEAHKEFETETEAMAFVNKCTLAYIDKKENIPIPQELKKAIS
jgi:hypothetical protein